MKKYLITGMTTSGKTKVSNFLIEEIGLSIVNSDKFHLFKEFSLGIGLECNEYQNVKKYLFQTLSPMDDVLSLEEYALVLSDILTNNAEEELLIEGCSFSYNKEIIERKMVDTAFCFILGDDVKLKKSIEHRVDRLFELGLIKETVSLLESGYENTYVMSKSIIYKGVIDYLEGVYQLNIAKKIIVSNAYRSALYQKKRYLKLKSVNFIEADKNIDSIINHIWKCLRS